MGRVRPPPVDGKPSGKAKREDFAGGGLFVKLWGRSPADQKAAPDVARSDIGFIGQKPKWTPISPPFGTGALMPDLRKNESPSDDLDVCAGAFKTNPKNMDIGYVKHNDRVVSDPPVLSIVDRLGGCCFRFRSH